MRLSTLLLLVPGLAFAGKLTIDLDRVINVSAHGDARMLFDEQALAGDPKANAGGVPTTQFTNGYINQAMLYPLEAIVDLGVQHTLTDVYYYDINGADSLHVWCGDGIAWSDMVYQTTSAYNQWVGKAVSCTGRYVRVQLKSPQAQITEIVLYGTANGIPAALPVATSHGNRTMDELMGVNGFIDDNQDLLAVTDFVREYHSWGWDDGNFSASAPAYPNNQFAWNPSWVRWTGGGWNFDQYYQDLQTRGISVSPVFQGNAGWMVGNDGNRTDERPIRGGGDPTVASSYIEHGDYMYQFAARFGQTAVAPSNLRVDVTNPSASGLGTVKYMEDWNEPDKTWKGNAAYFTPFDLAAMMSADYDGHQSTMGSHVGMKNADPNMLLVMPGLTEISADFVRSMKLWSDLHRSGSFPADVLNFHHYCTDAGGQNGVATTGISPEADSLRAKLANMVAFRDRWLPGKEVWLSEFGWDTHPQSVFRAKAVGSSDEYEMQARWLVRAFLEIAAAGVDRAQMFMLRDTWDSDPTKFATSGLVHDKYDTLSPMYQKKPSWFYVNTLHKSLRNYRFLDDQSTGGVRIYRFVNANAADSVAYAVWNPDDAATPQTVQIPWSNGSLRQVAFADAQALGVATTLIPGTGSVSVTGVSGRPLLLFGKTATPVATRLSQKLLAPMLQHKEYLVNGQAVQAKGTMRAVRMQN